MLAKSAIVAALATLALGGLIKRNDIRLEVIIPQGETLAQLNQTWTAECDQILAGKTGTPTLLVEQSSNAGDAYVFCATYTTNPNGPDTIDQYTVECANALGIQFTSPQRQKRNDIRELVVIPEGETIDQLNTSWTTECHKLVDSLPGTFSSLVEPSPNAADAYVYCSTYETGSDGGVTVNDYTKQCAAGLGIQFA